MRIYLSGRMSIDSGERVLGPHEFPGQQGRIAFAYLVTHRDTPVPRGVLADLLWPNSQPASWTTALSAIVSRLRTLLSAAGVDGATVLTSGAGCYELRLPRRCWIDHEIAADSIHEAESALGHGNPAGAYGPSAVAHHIARRPFLPGADGEWLENRRQKLQEILVRALECRARVYLWNEEYSLAVEAARDMIALKPLRETGYRLLMRAHTAVGNAAEALRVYEDCRALIVDELGVGPSMETRALHAEVLRSV